MSEFCVPTLKNIRKVVFSSCPRKQNDGFCLFAIDICPGSLAYFRARIDEDWINLKVAESHGYTDAIYYKEHLYALHKSGVVYVCDIKASSTEIVEMALLPAEVPAPNYPDDIMYLVESEGDLLMVYRRNKSEDPWSTKVSKTKFQVYRLDSNCDKKWDLVTNLGERALFLGLSQGFSLSESNVSGIKRNHIYVLDDGKLKSFINVRYDIGVVNLEDSSMELLVIGFPLAKPNTIWFSM